MGNQTLAYLALQPIINKTCVNRFTVICWPFTYCAIKREAHLSKIHVCCKCIKTNNNLVCICSKHIHSMANQLLLFFHFLQCFISFQYMQDYCSFLLGQEAEIQKRYGTGGGWGGHCLHCCNKRLTQVQSPEKRKITQYL